MNLIKKIQRFQLTTTGLRICGVFFLALGALGAMQQTMLLGAGNLTNSQLLTAMEQNIGLVESVTISLALQAAGAAAVPIFTFLLAEGVYHTSNYGRYFMRVCVLAVICQIPYNLLMSGSIGTITRLNPVFAMVICHIQLYFYRRFQQNTFSAILIKATALVGTFLWSGILGIDHGPCCVILAAAIWTLRGKPNVQTFLGIMLVFCCTIFSIFYLAAPIGFLIIHFYEGEHGNGSRLANYLAYPIILLIFGLMTIL